MTANDKKFKWKSSSLGKILYGEMNFTDDAKWRQIPIAIEETHLGSTMEKLLK